MPELMRHTRLESSRLRYGTTGIHGVWILDTVAATATYNMWDASGCPFNEVDVINAWLITNSTGAGDTIVINHVTTAAVAAALTDTANLALFAQDSIVDFSNIYRHTGSNYYDKITKGENIQVVTASAALARVFVEYVVVAS